MPRVKLTKSAIDAFPTATKDVVYWDSGYPGFGVKVTPKGRKVFIGTNSDSGLPWLYLAFTLSAQCLTEGCEVLSKLMFVSC